MRKPWLFLVTQPPEHHVRLWEALDMALAFSAFEQQVTIVFQAQGVRNLLAGEKSSIDPALVGVIASFPLYDIDWFACEQSLAQHCSQPAALVAGTATVTAETRNRILMTAREVFVF